MTTTPTAPTAPPAAGRTALLVDGPHHGAVLAVTPVAGQHPGVLRVEGCGHDRTCRYALAGGQGDRRAAAYRHLLLAAG